MITGATLFTGGGGADLGMAAAGIKILWGIDNDPQIVAVARTNGLPVQLGDIRSVSPNQQHVDFLHASPPCPHFSTANPNRGETAQDIAIAKGVVRFVRMLSPRFFTLENVSAYRHSKSFGLIRRGLADLGYMTHAALVNFADLGVPQTRRRLILRAVRGALLPPLPLAAPWRGWYQAVEDLLSDLPETQFAPWQVARGVDKLVRQTCMVAQGSYDKGALGLRLGREPAFTITGNSNMAGLRAFLVDSGNASSLTTRRGDEPAFAMVSSMGEHGTRPRAFVVDDQNNGAPDENGRRGLTVRQAHEPIFTVSATQTKCSLRAAVGGRVVALSPRCGARFQTIPDSYVLSGRNALDWRIIGNAVPPLAMRRICEGLLR